MLQDYGSLERWIATQLGVGNGEVYLTPLSGDASFRRYFRISLSGQKYIAVYSPPKTENNSAFLEVSCLLDQNQIRVPRVQAVNLDLGYMLLEDLGDLLLYDCQSQSTYFESALDMLFGFLRIDPFQMTLPTYSAEVLENEMNLFSDWFISELLRLKLGADNRKLFESIFHLLVESAIEQPQVFTHRDFHSRNIMCLSDGECAAIDFQDAVLGPVTYDFVSLVKDCYIARSQEEVEYWSKGYREQLIQRELLSEACDEPTFFRWVDLMGLQRHLKVLGVFSRLHLRDKKSIYLNHLPLVFHYVFEVVYRYAEFNPLMREFYNCLENFIRPVVFNQPWMKSR